MNGTPFPVFTVADLQRILTRTEPAALLIAPRILRRVIKRDRGLTGPGLQVPHRKSYVLDRDRLLRIADRDELGVEPDRDLPPVLLLFPRPDAQRVARRDRATTLLKYWRRLFHARVHLALRARSAGDGSAGWIHDRIRRIGRTEFDEAAAVLRQEHFLLPPGDVGTVYEEFAAVYLELRYFAPHQLPVYFPACSDFASFDATLALDVDAAALFAATRLEDAPDPVPPAPLNDEGERCPSRRPARPIPRAPPRAVTSSNSASACRRRSPTPSRSPAIGVKLCSLCWNRRRSASGPARAGCFTIYKRCASIGSGPSTPWTSSSGSPPGAAVRSSDYCRSRAPS